MAIEARFTAQEVRQYGGRKMVACGPDDPGAVKVENGQPMDNLYTDQPFWLKDAEYVRYDDHAQCAEAITLKAVSRPAGDDPDQTNAKWAIASPQGEMTMTIHNPQAFGKIKVGRDYRIIIEEVRAKRPKTDRLGVEYGQAEDGNVHLYNENPIDGQTTGSGHDPDATVKIVREMIDESFTQMSEQLRAGRP